MVHFAGLTASHVTSLKISTSPHCFQAYPTFLVPSPTRQDWGAEPEPDPRHERNHGTFIVRTTFVHQMGPPKAAREPLIWASVAWPRFGPTWLKIWVPSVARWPSRFICYFDRLARWTDFLRTKKNNCWPLILSSSAAANVRPPPHGLNTHHNSYKSDHWTTRNCSMELISFRSCIQLKKQSLLSTPSGLHVMPDTFPHLTYPVVYSLIYESGLLEQVLSAHVSVPSILHQDLCYLLFPPSQTTSHFYISHTKQSLNLEFCRSLKNNN
jgi:hypothetical protein